MADQALLEKHESLKVFFRDYLGGFLVKLASLLMVLFLPFVLLIRGAVFLHDQYQLPAWAAIFGGIFFSSSLLFLYFGIVYIRWLKRAYQPVLWVKVYGVAIIIVMLYCLPSLSYLSESNLKELHLKKEFRELHPILRLSLSTIIWLDRSLIMTDAERKPEDYQRMGLRAKKYSLHFLQSDGYGHAIDIRVKDRGELRNQLIQLYFHLMGLNTLRHFGTADHLHISLTSHDRPGAI